MPKNHETVFLMLVTLGGDAHAAYVIARDLQLRYKKVVICIAGDCYSAGTLIVLCANELVITDRGRLGPLDVQVLKKDELSERLSGLTMNIALEELHNKAFEALMAVALNLKETFGRQLSFRTAMDVASNMVAQMYGEVYKQIDPIRLGEDARALQIAGHYGTILGKGSSNLKPNAVERLLKGYPSHECIIDRKEAEELFKNLRPPGTKELELLNQLGAMATEASDGAASLLVIFPESAKQGKENGTDAQESSETTNGRKARSEPRSSQVPARGNGASRKSKPAAGN